MENKTSGLIISNAVHVCSYLYCFKVTSNFFQPFRYGIYRYLFNSNLCFDLFVLLLGGEGVY